MKTSIKTIGLLAVLAMGLTSPLFSQVPDLTKDTQSVDRKLTYNLGATGLRGWIHTKAANNLDAAQGPHHAGQPPDPGHPCGSRITCRRGRDGGRCDSRCGWQAVWRRRAQVDRTGHSGSGNGGPGWSAQAHGLACGPNAGSRVEARRDGHLQRLRAMELREIQTHPRWCHQGARKGNHGAQLDRIHPRSGPARHGQAGISAKTA